LKPKESEIKEIIIDGENKVEIYQSDKSGVGKSTQIILKIQKEKKKYIHFPLGGVFNRKDIIKRLKKSKITENCAIHLDLYDTDRTDLLLEFLFSMLITKFYGQNEDIYYLPNDIKIKVEIPNGFINYIAKFPILDLFPKIELTIKELAPLIVSDHLSSNEQIVANYLKVLNNNQIDDHDLYFNDDISGDDLKKEIEDDPSFRKNLIEATVLSQRECQEIIFNEIKNKGKINEPNYYQIKTFIDILSVQLKKFSRNFKLSYIFWLNQFKNVKHRSFALNSFINITKFFTEGDFTKIVKRQNITHDILYLFLSLYIINKFEK
jgi:hypothetical protein